MTTKLGWAAAESNARTDEYTLGITHLSLHTGTTGTTGLAEATGGLPAYARQAVTFSPSGGVGPLGAGTQPATTGVSWSTQVTFNIPAGSYTDWGAWTASTAGSFRLGNVLASTQAPGSQAILYLSVGVGPVQGA